MPEVSTYKRESMSEQYKIAVESEEFWVSHRKKICIAAVEAARKSTVADLAVLGIGPDTAGMLPEQAEELKGRTLFDLISDLDAIEAGGPKEDAAVADEVADDFSDDVIAEAFEADRDRIEAEAFGAESDGTEAADIWDEPAPDDYVPPEEARLTEA